MQFHKLFPALWNLVVDVPPVLIFCILPNRTYEKKSKKKMFNDETHDLKIYSTLLCALLTSTFSPVIDESSHTLLIAAEKILPTSG